MKNLKQGDELQKIWAQDKVLESWFVEKDPNASEILMCILISISLYAKYCLSLQQNAIKT